MGIKIMNLEALKAYDNNVKKWVIKELDERVRTLENEIIRLKMELENKNEVENYYYPFGGGEDFD